MKPYTLLTNISFAQFQEPQMPLRINISGLLITRSNKQGGILDPGHTLRGFGTESSNERFSYWLPDEALPYELTQQTQDQRFQMMTGKPSNKTLRPLFAGATLKFTNGLVLFLQAEDREQPIDVFEHDDIMVVWQTLFDRAIKYWKAPYMPHSVYGPPSAAEIFREQQ